MGKFYQSVKENWKRAWRAAEKGDAVGMLFPAGTPPPDHDQTPPPTGVPYTEEQMRLLRRKFRERYGRDPYSDQEIIDWWEHY